ncbi:EAL domain-containing protein [Companilactobacillus nodensis]|uniref:Diguanylate cyclase phosphodiesterase domain-containing protein n=1 Tax=Companilactobacillus nodensis DSM 19682 = JCM 14932 = NBRC 107160 TaxID=1423775 RepID=A0A0R1K681_9LACO|nr:EAL domain-containing protein [Companilactobacillus nodensis]KRK79135.1 diguanylate cyclase phosphodiesterase domain-containing protein [Companilactobacillus nodensis DSM 19682 = JCM 14932 = NBRC 107160]
MEPIYRYFVQPQIDTKTDSIIGYELLMKQHTPEGWRLPESFSAIDSQLTADLLIQTTKVLSLKVRRLSVNISREQLMTTSIANAIIQSQKQLYPTKLVVELTEDDSPQCYSFEQILSQLQGFLDNGIQISLDDVGTGVNHFTNIQQLLPFASELKFALQNFTDKFVDPMIQSKIHFWHAMSKEYGLRLVLEGIEDKADSQLSEKLGIHIKQGYYYSKPRLLKLPGDTCSCLA